MVQQVIRRSIRGDDAQENLGLSTRRIPLPKQASCHRSSALVPSIRQLHAGATTGLIGCHTHLGCGHAILAAAGNGVALHKQVCTANSTPHNLSRHRRSALVLHTCVRGERALDLHGHRCRNRKEVQPELLEETRHIEDRPPLQRPAADDMPVQGKPEGDRRARCLQPQPRRHVAPVEDAERPAVVALAPEDPCLQPAVRERSPEGLQHMLPVLVHSAGHADAPRPIKGQVRMPRLAAGPVAGPVLLERRLGHLASGGNVLALGHHGQGRRDTIVRLGRQHQTFWQSCRGEHRTTNTAEEVRIVDHHEVVVELAAGGGDLPCCVEVGNTEVHPPLRRWNPEERLAPENISIARGRRHFIGTEEEHLAEERHVECRPERLLLSRQAPTCRRLRVWKSNG
mmetsp:Transcript_20701/g.57230  ORF Transcript_20701/g.57230 Transcript_20701/m.57230 type:complete len:398 (-) Transcript_20701:427-1620(-)